MTKITKIKCVLCGMRVSPKSLLTEHPFEVWTVEYHGGGVKGQMGGGSISWERVTDRATIESLWYVLQKRLRQLAQG